MRDNPVCVDEVNTTRFANISSVDLTDPSSVFSASADVSVSWTIPFRERTHASVVSGESFCVWKRRVVDVCMWRMVVCVREPASNLEFQIVIL